MVYVLLRLVMVVLLTQTQNSLYRVRDLGEAMPVARIDVAIICPFKTTFRGTLFDKKYLRHDPAHHILVSPDTAFSESNYNGKFLR